MMVLSPLRLSSARGGGVRVNLLSVGLKPNKGGGGGRGGMSTNESEVNEGVKMRWMRSCCEV